MLGGGKEQQYHLTFCSFEIIWKPFHAALWERSLSKNMRAKAAGYLKSSHHALFLISDKFRQFTIFSEN